MLWGATGYSMVLYSAALAAFPGTLQCCVPQRPAWQSNQSIAGTAPARRARAGRPVRPPARCALARTSPARAAWRCCHSTTRESKNGPNVTWRVPERMWRVPERMWRVPDRMWRVPERNHSMKRVAAARRTMLGARRREERQGRGRRERLGYSEC